MRVCRLWALGILGLFVLAGCTMSSESPMEAATNSETPAAEQAQAQPDPTPTPAPAPPTRTTDEELNASAAPSEVAPSPGPGAPTGPFTLKLGGKVGESYSLTLNYRSETVYKGETTDQDEPEVRQALGKPSTLTIQAKLDQRIREVSDAGTTWIETVKSLSAKGTGMMAAQADDMNAEPQEAPVTRVRDARNRTTNTPDLEDTVPLVFPEGPVQVGDSWSESAIVASQKTAFTFRLAEAKRHQGKLYLRIEASSGVADVKTPEPLSMWVDASNGWLVQADGKVTTANAQGLETVTTFRVRRPNLTIP